MKTTRRIAFCGVLCALSTVVLLLTVFPYATYALAALAGIVLIPAVLECGTHYGVLSFAVTAVMALLLTPDVEAKWLFILFFGYYPIVHLRLSIRHRAGVAWAVKLLIFNAALVADFLLLTMFLHVPKEEFTIAGFYVPWLLLLMGNAVFLVYDIALSRVAALYRVRFHPLIARLMK